MTSSKLEMPDAFMDKAFAIVDLLLVGTDLINESGLIRRARGEFGGQRIKEGRPLFFAGRRAALLP